MTSQYDIKTLDQIFSLPNQGEFRLDVLQALKDLIEEMETQIIDGKKGSSGGITLKLGMKMDRGKTLNLSASLSVDHPKIAPATGIAWATKGGGITVANPNQQVMDLRDASVPPDIKAAE